MEIEFDPAKNARNKALHGLAFESVMDFDLDRAIVIPDTRRDYGEDRYIAVGELEGKIVVLIFTMRNGRLRVISLRRANAKERAKHAQDQKADR